MALDQQMQAVTVSVVATYQEGQAISRGAFPAPAALVHLAKNDSRLQSYQLPGLSACSLSHSGCRAWPFAWLGDSISSHRAALSRWREAGVVGLLEAQLETGDDVCLRGKDGKHLEYSVLHTVEGAKRPEMGAILSSSKPLIFLFVLSE